MAGGCQEGDAGDASKGWGWEKLPRGCIQAEDWEGEWRGVRKRRGMQVRGWGQKWGPDGARGCMANVRQMFGIVWHRLVPFGKKVWKCKHEFTNTGGYGMAPNGLAASNSRGFLHTMIGNDPCCSFVAGTGKRGQGNKCKQSYFPHCTAQQM